MVRQVNHTAEIEGRKPDRLHHAGQRGNPARSSRTAARACCWTCSAPSCGRWRSSWASSPTTASAASRDVSKSKEYHDRIEAINFSLAHDDGQSNRDLEQADVILVGVSRSGKTPTSLYLAMQYGLKAANYPLIPEDFERQPAARRRWCRTARRSSA